MIDLSGTVFQSEPYLCGVARGLFYPEVYERMIREYPDESQFLTLGQGYNKLSLSEKFNPHQYAKVLNGNDLWNRLYRHVKSDKFLDSVFSIIGRTKFIPPIGDYYARFEFSLLPPFGGALMPHRDIPSKVLTLIIPITDVSVPEWGTDILIPREPNPVDYQTPREQFDLAWRTPFEPNVATVFVRSDKSWHSVGPLNGGEGYRRTLTVNVERLSE